MVLRLSIASLCAVLAVAGLLAISRPGARAAAGRSGDAGRVAGSDCPWLNESLPVSERVNMLLARMTLRDKIDEMYVDAPLSVARANGSFYEGWVQAQPALCIPILREQDGSLGVYAAPDATQLPAEVSLASAWDPALAYRYGVINAKEHRAKGIAMVLGPGVNIQRDPRWGRNFEMFSEDPFLTSALGVADIEGLQSQDVIAEVKHLATYNQETYRATSQDNTIVAERALHEIYLPPFYSAVVQAHVASVMCAYPLLNGTYSCQSPSLIRLLDQRWGFGGFLRSDSGANASTVGSVNVGLDQERGSFYWDNGALAAAVADGQVNTPTIDAAVRRILSEMFRFGLFNHPPKGTIRSPASTPADRAFALKAAERGTVLLQNLGNILPLRAAATGSIAVIGPDGTTHPVTAGGGSAYVNSSHVISPRQGIASRAGPRVKITSYSGTDPARAAAAAAKAKVAVVFASHWERETRDLKSISLPGRQNAMIESVAAANPNTVVVLNTGGPVLMPWLRSVRGVVEAWYPGQGDGAAVASVLFGATDPSGHLPETFPTSLSEIPTASQSQFPGVDGTVAYSEGLDVGYRWYDAKRITPLFPFGYGLSYTRFRFSHLTVTPGSVLNSTSGPETAKGQGAGVAKVTAVITNTGEVSGSDVAQLYIGDPAAAGEPPRQLEGFQRVTLRAHQSRTVTFTITGHELSYFDTAADGWTLPNGSFTLYVGDSSALSSLPLRGHLNVTSTIGARYARVEAPAAVQPGATFTAGAKFVNDGNLPITGGAVRFAVPSGWTAVPLDGAPTLSLAPGQSVTRHFRVTTPMSTGGEMERLTAQLTSAGAESSGELNASATVLVPGPISVSAPSPAVAAADGTAATEVSIANHLPEAVVVDLDPAPRSDVTITTAQPPVTVPANATVNLKMSVSVAPGTAPRTIQVPLNPSFTYRGASYPLAASLTVDIPYASLRAAYDNSAISNDGDLRAADFDGIGDSYSEQALTAAGLARGATVTVGGAALRWPDAPAGAPDSVVADGQTILMPRSPTATRLSFLGASSYYPTNGAGLSAETAVGTIEYTDGTDQPYVLSLDNWFMARDGSGNTTVAKLAYVNDSNGATNHGVVGRRRRKARVFAVSVPLERGKTVASVTLPMLGTLPGVHPMDVFAMALGRASA